MKHGSASPDQAVSAEHCMVCGSPLDYLGQSVDMTCTYCGKTERGHIRCPSGHYLCDACHNKDSMMVIEDVVRGTTLRDPLLISELLMSRPSIPMLGCQHAFIAGGALMAALRNEGSRTIADSEIREVFSRTEKQAHGGYCGLTGVCGIAPAIGAVFSVLTGSRCGKDEEQRITMEAVTRVSRAITDLTGPSCCKAYVRASLSTATAFLKEALGISLPADSSRLCVDGARHPHGCRETRCPYSGKQTTKITREVTMSANPMDRYDEFFSMTYQSGALDVKTKHLAALAASLGAG